jgi:hypothetical protein
MTIGSPRRAYVVSIGELAHVAAARVGDVNLSPITPEKEVCAVG